jgi:uncharacterized membrane protein YidH (DUF202 family)
MSQDLTKEDTNTVLARERTDMASDRTRWAADRTLWADDRTLIAWIRTSLSLIGFGFGIGRALEYLEKLGREADPFYTAQIFGGGFIFLGVVALITAIIQHVRVEKRLKKQGYDRVEAVPLGLLTAIVLLLIGVYAFVVILANP